MLGTVRVFACDNAWCGDDDSQRVATGWGHGYEVADESHWELVGQQHCPPSWDSLTEINLEKTLVIKPGQIRALYMHSALPDDLGIQYQSYRGNAIVAEDDIVQIIPGVGHTGHIPFRSGWYRGLRGPAGALSYHATLRTWTAMVRALPCSSVPGRWPVDLTADSAEPSLDTKIHEGRSSDVDFLPLESGVCSALSAARPLPTYSGILPLVLV